MDVKAILGASKTYTDRKTSVPIENIIYNGDFSAGNSGWTTTNGVLDTSQGYGVYSHNESFNVTASNSVRQSLLSKADHDDILYLSFFCKSIEGSNAIIVRQVTTRMTIYAESDFNRYSETFRFNSEPGYYGASLAFGIASSNPYSFALKNIVVVNLTKAFGAGNEPSKEFMDHVLEGIEGSWFEGAVDVNAVSLALLKIVNAELVRKDFEPIFSVQKIGDTFPHGDLPGIGEPGSLFDYTNDNHELVYSIFDNLMAENPEYITRTELGKTDDGIPVYEYFFDPPRPGDDYVEPYPKILIGASIHGNENLSTTALTLLFKRICEEWQDDPVLEYLRFCVRFAVCPIRSPRDYNNKTYVNVNGVNINRNFSNGWDASSDPTKGPEPFSEVETRIQRDWLYSHTDALHHVDCHVRGGRQMVADDRMMWLGMGRPNNSFHCANTIEQMSRRWKRKYPQLPDIPHYGYVTRTTGGNGTINGFCNTVVGIDSTLWEGFSMSTTMNQVENADVVNMNVDFLGQHLVNIIKFYQGK